MDNNSCQFPRLGYAYVPMQQLGELYGVHEALDRGTLFPELDLPMKAYVDFDKEDQF